MMAVFIPPPPFRDLFHIGPLTIHMYSLMMVLAILVALWWSVRRMVAAGGDFDACESIGLIAVLCGIVGARLYHVITEHARYFGPGLDPWDALKVWNGGLSVIGSIIGGGLAVWVLCRRKGISTGDFVDCVAPTLFVAQAIGRVGNWFNQEAFGKPTTLPWALEIDPEHRPIGYAQFATFHPTFLYEGLWNLLGCALLLWAIRRFKLQHGKAFCCYVLWYTFGRFFIELIRIDPVDTVGGLRINNWTDGAIFLVTLAVFIYLLRRFPGSVDQPLAGMGEKWRGATSGDETGAGAAASDETVADEAEDDEAEPVAPAAESSAGPDEAAVTPAGDETGAT